MNEIVDLDKIRLEATLKRTYDLFASWSSDFAIVENASPPSFRGSQIPHCPLVWAAESQRTTPRIEKRSFMLDYAARHGTLVHEMVQRWLGVVGVMHGRWKCDKCGKILPGVDPYVGVLGPVHHCGLPCSYVEYEMKEPGLSNYGGHCDGVVKLQEKFMPIEMKQRNKDVLDHVRRAKAAKPNNLLQCTSYRRVLPAKLSKTIPTDKWHDYVAVMYIDRKDIRNREFVISPYRPELFDAEVTSVRRTRRIIELKLWNRLEGICHVKDDAPFCPYAHACFCTDPMSVWERILPGISKPRLPEDIPERYRRARS